MAFHNLQSVAESGSIGGGWPSFLAIVTRRAGGKIGRSPRALVFAPLHFPSNLRQSGFFVSLKPR